MSRIGEAFSSLDGRAGVVAYVMGGDPDFESCLRAIGAVVRGGADILEIGIPFSDPIADGKSIQAAAVRALKASTTPTDVLRIARETKESHGVPVVLMTYYNPVFCGGVGRFLDSAKRAGVDGVIVPDLPLEEAAVFGRASRKRGIDTILLAAPSTSDERMKEVVANTSGFLYLVSVLGVTGARSYLRSETVSLVKSARRFTAGKVPLAVGFGISKPEHVGAVVRAGADAVIVGSAIVDMVKDIDGEGDEVTGRIEAYVASLGRAASKG